MGVEKRNAQEIIAEAMCEFAITGYPTFIAIADQNVLELCVTENTQEQLNEADRAEDYENHPDGQRLFGFENDDEGIAALKMLHALVPIQGFVLDGKGDYVEADLSVLGEWNPDTDYPRIIPEGRIIGEILERFSKGLEALSEEREDDSWGSRNRLKFD